MLDILYQVISGLLVIFICGICKLCIKKYKHTENRTQPVQPTSKLKIQFFVALLLLPTLSIIAALIENKAIKVVLFFLAALSFIAVWGVFDELFDKYPVSSTKEAAPNQNTKKSSD